MDWDYSRHYARFHADTPEHDAQLHALFQRWLGAHLPADKNTALLDVGCGRGYALGWLQGLGYTQLAGIDPDAGQVAFAQSRGLNVQRAVDTVDFLRGRTGAYDFVQLMDVLEHVPHAAQGALLRAIHAALRPGGRLLCTVPNADSPLASRWRHIDYTHHLLFTVESLEFVLSQTGFRVERLHAAEFIGGPRLLCWPPTRRTLRWWLCRLGRLQPRLACLGELGWHDGWRIPLSPNLLTVAVRE